MMTACEVLVSHLTTDWGTFRKGDTAYLPLEKAKSLGTSVKILATTGEERPEPEPAPIMDAEPIPARSEPEPTEPAPKIGKTRTVKSGKR
jgi:hypothetical protein